MSSTSQSALLLQESEQYPPGHPIDAVRQRSDAVPRQDKAELQVAPVRPRPVPASATRQTPLLQVALPLQA